MDESSFDGFQHLHFETPNLRIVLQHARSRNGVLKALEEIAATEITEEKIEYESDGEATTSMADLLKKAGF